MKRFLESVLLSFLLVVPVLMVSEAWAADDDLNVDEAIDREKEETTTASDAEGLVGGEESKEITDKELKDLYLREYKDGEMIRTVERGIYMKTGIGAGIFLGGIRDYAPQGLALQLGLGYDILPEYLEIELNLTGIGTAGTTDKDSDGYPDSRDAMVTGSHLTLLTTVMVAGTYRPDLRWLLKVRAGGGIYYDDAFIDGYTTPQDQTISMADAKDVAAIGGVAGGGIAFEYFTPLRHFSIGMDVDFFYIIGPNTMLLNLMPTMKYTF